MKNKTLLLELLAITLVFGMTVIGCGDDPNNGDPNNGDNGGQELPVASGNNAVSGKTYYFDPLSGSKITFSTTAEGDTNGTYARAVPKSGTYRAGEKFTYQDIETGIYTWNEEAKTVTLKCEKAAFGVYVIGDSPNGTIEIDIDLGPLGDRTAFPSAMQAVINKYKQQMGEAFVNQYLSTMGFSSVSDYIDYMVNETFDNKTNAYSFSADGTALFLEQALPANKGANELSGQTYYGLTWNNDTNNEEKDTRKVYVFTASGYTFTNSQWWGTPEIITGSYAYNSDQKRVWLSISTINGKDRAAYYAEQWVYDSKHNLADDNAYRAAQTNGRFRFDSGRNWPGECNYNSTNKTIETMWGEAEAPEPEPPIPPPPDWGED